MVLEPMVVWGKGGKVIDVIFVVEAGTWCVYLELFCKWSREGSLSQLEWRRYITPNKPIKAIQMILEKIQQRSIIANGVRQR